MYRYNAKILEVYDGDTVTAQIDLGFNISVREKLRLYDINAPEMRGDEKEQGKLSRDYLREMILDKWVVVETNKDKKGKYGRYIATIWIDVDEVEINVNKDMVEKGYAKQRSY